MAMFHGYVKLPEGKLPNDYPMSILLENMVISWSEPSIWDHLYPMRNSGSENRLQQKTGYPTEFSIWWFFSRMWNSFPSCRFVFCVFLCQTVARCVATLVCRRVIPSPHVFPPKPMNLRPPSDVSWFRFAPVTSSLNYSYKYHKP